MSTQIVLPIYIGKSPTLGIRGVMAARAIKAGEVIERCPALVYKKNPEHISETVFEYYVFEWDDEHEALALGYGSLYNHNSKPNVEVDFDFKKREIVFSATKNIKKDEEMFIHYNDGDNETIDPNYFSFDKTI